MQDVGPEPEARNAPCTRNGQARAAAATVRPSRSVREFREKPLQFSVCPGSVAVGKGESENDRKKESEGALRRN